VPIGASALRSAKLVNGARLVVIEGADHGMCSTDKDRINQELLGFFEESAAARRRRSLPPAAGGDGRTARFTRS
jgi:hypothetical protein